MTTAKNKLLTADDLLVLDSKGVQGELIRGVLHETVSAGGEHGKIVVNFAVGLGNFVKPRRLGTLFASDTGVWLERGPDTVREPDVAFVSAERLPLDARIRGYLELVPDLVVEIVSPSDTRREVEAKALMWLSYGVTLVWVANPETRTIDVRPSGAPVFTLTEDGVLDGGTVLPGFTLPVREVFE